MIASISGRTQMNSTPQPNETPGRRTPPVFVINLERSTERREKISLQLNEIGLDFELVTATDGAALSRSDRAAYNEAHVISNISRPMSAAEVGCYISHAKLWQRVVAEDIPWAVILEDDILIQADLKTILSAVDRLTFKWDVIRLAGLIDTPSQPLFELSGNRTLSVPLQGASGGQAYCLSRAGARKLLAYSTTIRGTVDDHVIDNCWKTGLEILAVQPYPIVEDKRHTSNIEPDRKELFQAYRGPRKKRRSIRQLLIRRRYKIGRSLGRRYYYFIHYLLAIRMKMLHRSMR
jgi:glycosyl transferase family 25